MNGYDLDVMHLPRARFEDWPKVKQVRCGVDEMFLRVEPTPAVKPVRLCVSETQAIATAASSASETN